MVGERLQSDFLQGPELLERENAPRERGEHAGESADLADAEPPVTPLDPEHEQGGDGAAQRHGEGTPPHGLRHGAAASPRTGRGGGPSGQHRVHHPREVERPPGLVPAVRLGHRHEDVPDELRGEDDAQDRNDAVDAGSEDCRNRTQQCQEQDVRDRVGQVRRRGQGIEVLGRHCGRNEHRSGHGRHAERPHESVQPRARPRSGYSGAQQGQRDHEQCRVGGEPARVGEGRERLRHQRCDDERVHEVPDDVQHGRDGGAPPEDPLIGHPSSRTQARQARHQRCRVEQDDVEDDDLHGRVWNEGDACCEAEGDHSGHQDESGGPRPPPAVPSLARQGGHHAGECHIRSLGRCLDPPKRSRFVP